MKVTIVEGTPEELKALMPSLFTDKNIIQYEDEKGVETKITNGYRAMLTRIDIPQGQIDLYRVLSNGELEYHEYLKQMKRTSKEISGLHGALGNRINHTKEILEAGLPGNMTAICVWRKDKGKDYLRLKPDFVEVLKKEGII